MVENLRRQLVEQWLDAFIFLRLVHEGSLGKVGRVEPGALPQRGPEALVFRQLQEIADGVLRRLQIVIGKPIQGAAGQSSGGVHIDDALDRVEVPHIGAQGEATQQRVAIEGNGYPKVSWERRDVGGEETFLIGRAGLCKEAIACSVIDLDVSAGEGLIEECADGDPGRFRVYRGVLRRDTYGTPRHGQNSGKNARHASISNRVLLYASPVHVGGTGWRLIV